MEESVLYLSEGKETDKLSMESFARSISVHGSRELAIFRQASCPRNGAAMSGVGAGERFFVACRDKALLQVYSWGKEGVDQRIPIPEAARVLALGQHPSCPRKESLGGKGGYGRSKFRVPWLLAAGTGSGRLFLWELSSGNLVCVKDAHYQGLSVMRFSRCGTFLVTGGLDARVMVWRVADLISIYDKSHDVANVRPFVTFTDHTLPVTDLVISDTPVTTDLNLYTCSGDGTLRIYDVLSKSLLTTFVLPCGIECVTTDPAQRACYVGLANGAIRMIPLYRVDAHTSLLSSVGGCGKIVTVEHDPNLLETFSHHQQSPASSLSSSTKTPAAQTIQDNKPKVTQIAISMDGTNLVSGDTLGRVYVSDVVSKQVIKTLLPSNSPISFLQVSAYPLELTDNSVGSKIDKKHRLIPQLKRVVADNNAVDHSIYMEIPPSVQQQETFDDWLARKSQEEMTYKNLSMVNSEVTVLQPSHNDHDKVKELEQKLAKVSKAYTDLRQVHQELYEDHKKLLSES